MKFVLAGLLLGLGAAVKFSHELGGNLSISGANALGRGNLSTSGANALGHWEQRSVYVLGAPKEALIAMVKKAAQEDAGANDGTVSSLTNMAENMVRMAASQAPSDMQQSLGTIGNLVSGMLEKVVEDSRIAWSGVQNNSNFQKCTSDMYACMGVIFDPAGNSSSLYDRCISQLQRLEELLDTCLEEKAITDSTTNELCAAFQAIDEKYGGTYAPEVSQDWRHFSCVDPFTGTYRDYLQRFIGWLAEWRAKKAACQGGNSTDCGEEQQAVNNKRAECSALERPISDDCKPWLHKRGCCSEYDMCWQGAEATRSQAETTANQLSINLKAQYRSLKRIECLLDVLALEGDQTAALEACIAKTHDTSPLDPVIAPMPSKATCDPGQPPGGADCSAYQNLGGF